VLSVIIPAFNESDRLAPTLDSIIDYFKGFSSPIEIIVVDDGSLDQTSQIARSKKGIKVIQNNRNLGKGESVRRGIIQASGEMILVMDADSSASIQELDKLIPHIANFDIVIGSRYQPESHIIIDQPLARQINSILFLLVARRLLHLKFTDTQCGFKLYKSTIVKNIFSVPFIGKFSFDVEILWRAKKAGFEILEVPIHWSYRYGSKITLFRIMGMYLDLLRAWLKLNSLL
jgi:dolichyl-phosphate beta-glucosyltransferase